MYLIRAEARTQQDKVTGDNSAQTDINILRDRANAVTVRSVSKTQMLRLIEEERRYELAFEGHGGMILFDRKGLGGNVCILR